MDLSQITAKNAIVEIKHPATFEPIGLQIELRPSSSPEVRKVQRKFTEESLNNRRGKWSAAKLEANRLELVSAAVAGWKWTGTANINGEQPKFSPEALRDLLKYDWIKEQLDEALGDEALFFQS